MEVEGGDDVAKRGDFVSAAALGADSTRDDRNLLSILGQSLPFVKAKRAV